MDGENSYESDISESWSLVDINLNEESISANEAQPKLEESYSPDPKDIDLKKSGSIELEDFVKQCRESMTNFHGCCHSDSDSSTEHNDVFKEDESDGGSEEDKNDSGDAESIEILDVDGNHMDSETERIDISMIDNQELKNCAYQSDDEESWGEKIDSKNKSTSLTVISRKRNLFRHSKSSDDIVNSDILSKGNPSLNSHSDDDKKLKMQLDAISRLPVYKHYRNNVVNTVLSLSMGIVFAGVACIAIGHFLGVHDAAETAVELVDALKKLQIENVALQSRWSQLTKDSFRQNYNSKFEVHLTEPPEAVSCEKRPNYASARTKTTNANQAGASEIQSSLKSIQWLNKLENMINEKMATEGNEIDFSSIGKLIHNQLNIINDKKVEGFKLIEDSDRKISKLLQIIERLSASQKNIEKLCNRLIRLMDKVNHKLFSDKAPRRVPVTENDLNSVKGCLSVKNLPEEYSKSFLVYKFPQPEEFYETKNNSNLTEERTRSENNNALKEKDERKVKKEEKDRKNGEKKWRREKPKEAERKSQKKVKPGAKISDKITAKKNISKDPEQMKFIFGRFNERKETDKKFLKHKDQEKVKRKIKKSKRSKILRVSLPKKFKMQLKKSRYSRVCSGYECFNLTGYWLFKYASGRQEFRRHQTLNDWQFERARGRKEQRNEDDVGSWQFRRALARESERNDNRWHRERYRKNHDSQDFNHKPIS